MADTISEPDWTSIFVDRDVQVDAADQWATLVEELATAGTLAVANGHTMTRLVEFRIQYRKAARHVAEHGAILTAKRAKVGQWNPFWAVMRQADERIVVLEAKLGIDPVSRGKATKAVTRGGKKKKAADTYLSSPSGG